MNATIPSKLTSLRSMAEGMGVAEVEQGHSRLRPSGHVDGCGMIEVVLEDVRPHPLASRTQPPMQLSNLTWTAVQALDKSTPVVVPVAAMEQHGHHLPLFTDSMLL